MGRRQNEKEGPGVAKSYGVARAMSDGTLGDCFFSFAVAGTRSFLSLLPQVYARLANSPMYFPTGARFFFCVDLA